MVDTAFSPLLRCFYSSCSNTLAIHSYVYLNGYNLSYNYVVLRPAFIIHYIAENISHINIDIIFYF